LLAWTRCVTARAQRTSILCNLLQRDGIAKEKVLGLGTDGCAAMTGVHKGFVTLFKAASPFVCPTVCSCHRGATASKHAMADVPYFRDDFFPVLTEVWIFFRETAVHAAEFKVLSLQCSLVRCSCITVG
jgi:hypothetical protein